MKIFKIKNSILLFNGGSHYLIKGVDWDEFINDDELPEKTRNIVKNARPVDNGQDLIDTRLEAPVGRQEIWASGVTYYNSKMGREEESKKTGGGQFYAMVYEAERPELFFKASAYRTVGSGGEVRIRKDSSWDVPEPELTLLITSNAKIVGYTIGNDMSSRSIEGENPLYLPQAKTYDGCAGLGPCIYVSDKPLDKATPIHLRILRNNAIVFEGDTSLDQMRRKPEELVSFLYRECSFPHGSFLMTGTGIIPSKDFSLQKDDEIRITIDPIGTLINTVK